jgi:hypothetical protein
MENISRGIFSTGYCISKYSIAYKLKLDLVGMV